MLSIYENIRKERKKMGLTQSDLAKKLGYADKSMIAKIEKGQVDLPQSKIFAFAKALDTTPSKLMGWDGVEPPDKLTLTDKKEIKIVESYRIAPTPTKQAIDVLLGVNDGDKDKGSNNKKGGGSKRE